MRRETIEVPTPDGTADAYLVGPDDDQHHPGVLFIIDAFGLRPRIEEMADRIAEHGYVVLAPNVFYRGGRAPIAPAPDLSDPDSRGAFFEKVRPMIEELTPERVKQDGEAYLRVLEQVAPGPVAITGYCMGARLGLQVAAANPDRVAALGGFHGGRLATDDPESPHRLIHNLRAELFLGHADNDQSMDPDQIARLDQALDEAGVVHTTEVFEGAAHGYTMSDTAAYNEAAAERHFDELFALLERTLAPASA